MAQKNNYIFTNKIHPKQGILSVLLGLVSGGSISTALYLTYLTRGEALLSYGLAVLLATLIAIAGFVLAILGKMKGDVFMLTPFLGMLLNGICLIAAGIIIYAGVYGL